jgi:peptide/nickel transport system substrate-binding protein
VGRLDCVQSRQFLSAARQWQGGWFGWPTDEPLEALRQNWFDAPDLPAQKTIAAAIQRRAFEVVPFMPLGQVFQPTAFRSNVSGIVKAAIPLFWGVRKT